MAAAAAFGASCPGIGAVAWVDARIKVEEEGLGGEEARGGRSKPHVLYRLEFLRMGDGGTVTLDGLGGEGAVCVSLV